jgi:hypothetical protein
LRRKGSDMTLRASVLVAATALLLPFPLNGQESERVDLDQPGSIIKRFVDPLTRQEHRPIRSILTSDAEHASSIAPVLTPGKPVYIRYYQNQKSALPEQYNYVLDDGRVFVNYEDPYEMVRMPVVKMRPVDGKTRIPFLVRTLLKPTETIAESSSMYAFVRLPIIFAPRLEVRRVMIGGKRADFRVTTGPDDACYTISVPLSEEHGWKVGRQTEVVMDGMITLNDYEVMHPSQFRDFDETMEQRLRSVSRSVASRDYIGEEERATIEKLAEEIRQVTTTQYQQLVLAHRVAASKISYFQNNMQRTAVQVLTEGIGDCDDYSRVMVTILRSLGIPSRIAIGYLYDFNSMGAHAWVETALRTKSGKVHWFICDPTLASASSDKDMFIQFKNRIYLYPLRFDVKTQNLACDSRTEILLNWNGKEKEQKLPSAALPALINSFNESFRASFSQRLVELRQQDLVLRRQFLFNPGASYILTDRPVTPDRSHLSLSLDSEERLIAELSVNDDDFDLDSPQDQQVVALLRQAYQHLKQVPFEGSEARHSLEFAFFRDRYSDRLQRVRLRVCRYLVEQHLRPIVESFRKTGLLVESEAGRILALHQISSGRNLYFLQELARQQSIAPAEGAGEALGPPS